MIEDNLPEFEKILTQRIAERQLPFADLKVNDVPEASTIEIHARCTDDPMFEPPSHVKSAEETDGPWNHRQVLVRVIPTVSDETERQVLLTAVRFIIDAGHAHFSPIPDSAKESGCIETAFNWEFDLETMDHGLAEMREW